MDSRIAPPLTKTVSWETLTELRVRWRNDGKVVVWTNGCFDLLHVGHVRSLCAARCFGDVLVVGVNSDKSVRSLKGLNRPAVPELERIEVLAALQCVTSVVLFDELTPLDSIGRLRPDVCCKGADYAPPNGKPCPELDLVTSYGGHMEFIPLALGHSTSGILKAIIASSK